MMPDEPSKSRRPKSISIGKKILFSLVLFVGLLAALEGTCRVIGLGKKQQTHQDIANWKLQWRSDFYVFPAQDGINQDGLRDRNHDVNAADGVTRVVCLGDSVTFGWLIDHEQSYPTHLATELNRTHSVEVFNVALPGWSTRQQRLAYERIARRYRPDYVILGVCLNDLAEMQNNLAAPPRFVGTLYRHSNFVRFLLPGQQTEINRVQELFTDQESSRVQQAWKLIFEEIRTLERMVEADDAQFAVFLFPFRNQVLPNPQEAIPQREFKKFCREEKIQFWDGRDALQSLGNRGFIDYDHLSGDGGAAVALQIAESNWIVDPPAKKKPTNDEPARPVSP